MRVSFIITIAAALAFVALAQDVPLPRTPPGFRVGTGPVVIEGFMDLLVRAERSLASYWQHDAMTPPYRVTAANVSGRAAPRRARAPFAVTAAPLERGRRHTLRS